VDVSGHEEASLYLRAYRQPPATPVDLSRNRDGRSPWSVEGLFALVSWPSSCWSTILAPLPPHEPKSSSGAQSQISNLPDRSTSHDEMARVAQRIFVCQDGR
jgi:hypothetical protein